MIYSRLMQMYKGLTPNHIAEMTPEQQLLLYSPSSAGDTTFFNTYEDYAKWLTSQR